MSKGQPWKEYEPRRKRTERLCIRLSQEEKELLGKLSCTKNMTRTDLLVYLINEEMEREENK